MSEQFCRIYQKDLSKTVIFLLVFLQTHNALKCQSPIPPSGPAKTEVKSKETRIKIHMQSWSPHSF